MARARNIKPGFFTNDVLAECSALARILFQGLWCHADREGRLEDRPRKLKAEILPYDDCDAEELLCQLESRGFIIRYSHGDERFIQVVNFCKHQNPHVKESESTIPAPCLSGAKPEQAGLIPDSLNLIPDSSISSANALEVRSDADEPAESEAGSKKLPSCPHQKVIELYHESLPYCPQVREWNTTRQKYLQSRWREKAVSLGWQQDAEGLEWFKRFFSFVGESKFLTGKSDGRNGKPPFIADLEWLMKPSNFAKVVEGKYHQ